MNILTSASTSFSPSSFITSIALVSTSKYISKSAGRSIERELLLQQEDRERESSEKDSASSSSKTAIRDLRRQSFLLKSFFSAKFAASQPLFTYIELFAGVGGFGLACEKLGGRCVFASELILHAKKCWQRNFGNGDSKSQNEAKQKAFGAKWNEEGMKSVSSFMEEQKSDIHDSFKCGDIRKVPDSQIPKHADVLCGGFPCQPFSRAGNQPATQVDDGNLYLQIIRILKIAKPKILFLENVPGLHTAEEGEALKKISESLREVGYDVITGVMDSSCLVPQIRRRMYFVGFRREKKLLLAGEINNDDETSGKRRDRHDEFNELINNIISSSSLDDVFKKFRWPLMPKIRRSFSEIVQTDPEVIKNFILVAARWQKHLQICPDDPSRWFIKMDRPGPTLVKSYRRGPGVKSGQKFLEAIEKKEKKTEEGQLINDEDAASPSTSTSAYTREASGWHNLVPLPQSLLAVAANQNNNNDDASPSSSSPSSSSVPVRWISHREAARMQGFPETFWIPEENESHGPGISLFGNAVSVPVVASILHSALWACRGSVPFYRRRVHSQDEDRFTLIREMLLDAVPFASRSELQKQLDEAKKNNEFEDVVKYSRII